MSEKKNYSVTLPVVGSITFAVEAESEEAAIDAAFGMDAKDGDLWWDVVEQVVRGNVFYGDINEPEVEEL